MIIRQIGADDVPRPPLNDDAKQAHYDNVTRMLATKERPLEIRLDGIFPETTEDSIHFVSAHAALTETLKQGTEPQAFRSMRDTLFERLKACVTPGRCSG